MDLIKIESPRLLQEVAGSVLPYVDDGRLQQVACETSLDEIAQGNWGDVVASSFRCSTCGNRYELVVETYHGRGGTWRRLPTSQET